MREPGLGTLPAKTHPKSCSVQGVTPAILVRGILRGSACENLCTQANSVLFFSALGGDDRREPGRCTLLLNPPQILQYAGGKLSRCCLFLFFLGEGGSSRLCP